MTLVKDPLLTAANIVLMVFIAITGLAAAMLLLGGPGVMIFKDRILAEFVSEGVTGAAAIFPGVGIVFFAIGLLLVSGVWFLVLLRRIVTSVGEGDPFIPENATRLSHMGWIAFIGQLASVPIGAAVIWIARMVEDSATVHVGSEFGFSGGGILLTLILFVLARVFRRGAAMREELEGTV